ncbi:MULTISPECIES: HisA/HisF-related TIM barrel protein [unclassified Paraburkholderia]|uniref:HisA/HisF-related TIM barrel protein n=1 Tax=unclassified Paraburkholderia TaxID=2615204 RepID=UPI0016146A45|nr:MULTISPECIES: HisA/HisF-related TIM barrel protein [unclassified Paraburkholderia]MBB5443906.1 phosphoribosylformimino-5-aminoimidazole carboxamide ribotide isomerase [Paraburkholderia sp. WSM4177]MBB5484968.1 phosphoribosylformimino-5-aminoimidazole carboxamide ribotide isomerase [Paraburkholderia sp. WSM4180]
MQVIPVLDLLDGQVVRAVRGERSAYRPIQSRLVATSDPLATARALLEASGARTLYIADLGAILQRGAHASTLAALRAALPGIELWLDAGFADYASMRALFERIDDAIDQHDSPAAGSHLATLVPVFGSETLRDIHALHAAQRAGLAPILSLDHRAGELLAAAALDRSSAWWPSCVIAMTLDQVGSYAGPDLATFERVRAQAAAHTTLIGAGGIRNRDDLAAAAGTGASAWLVASALHDRQIDCAHSDSA